MTDPTESSRSRVARMPMRRNYQACLECKKQKIKCHLGDSETPHPPCSRCRRVRLNCVFGPARKIGARTARPPTYPANGSGGSVATTSAEKEHPPVQPEENEAGGTSFGAVYSSPVVHQRHEHEETEPSAEPAYKLSAWKLFPLCSDGCLSPREADYLIGYFFQWMCPFFPIVDHKYSSSMHWGELLTEETLLCATILTTAARYTWYRASASSSRAVEMHAVMYRHVQSDIQSFVWSSKLPCNRKSTVLGVIESILLLAEWHPRPLDVVPFPSEMSGGYPLEAYAFGPAAATSNIETEARRCHESLRSLNLTSWRLLSTATNLADEIGLHQTISQSAENDRQDGLDMARRARVRHFLVYLVFGKCVDLGRKSLLTLPTDLSRPVEGNPSAVLLESWFELCRLARLIDNNLYPSPATTADIISSERYPFIIDDISSLFASWRTRYESVPGSSIFSKYLDLVAHSSQAWLRAVALQAYVRRCRILACHTRNCESGEKFPTISLQDSIQVDKSRQDLQIIDSMVQDCKHTLEITLELYREGSLRHAPLNVMTNVTSAGMALLRVQHLPLSAVNGSMDLLWQLADALEEAGPDDAHILSQCAVCLRRLLRCTETDLGSSQFTTPHVDPALGTNALGTGPGTLCAPEEIGPAIFGHLFDAPFLMTPLSDNQNGWLGF